MQKEMKANLSDNFCVIRFIFLLCITKGINSWFVSLAQKQALKNFATNIHLELTGRHPFQISREPGMHSLT